MVTFIHPVIQQTLLKIFPVKSSLFGTGVAVMTKTDIVLALKEIPVKLRTWTTKSV